MSDVWADVYNDVVNVVKDATPNTATRRGGKEFRHLESAFEPEDLREHGTADRHFAVYASGQVSGDGMAGQVTQYIGLVSDLTVVVAYTPPRRLSELLKMLGQDRDLLKYKLEIPSGYSAASKVWRREVTSSGFSVGDGNAILTLEVEVAYRPNWT